jgi:hypothetical protein
MNRKLQMMMVGIVVAGLLGIKVDGQTSVTTQIQNSILYTTYTPDTVLSIGNSHDTTSTLRFDINNDGINDFELQNYVLFTDSGSWDTSQTIRPLDTLQNTWFISIDTNHYCANPVPVGIDSGEVIEDTLGWSNSCSDIYFNTNPNYLCDMTEPADFLYYPIKLINNIGDSYYGWIYFSANDSIILKETAICLIPNQPIYTGHRGLYFGIPIISKNDKINFYPNPANTILNIHSQLAIDNGQLIITDVMGNEVYHELLPSNVNCQLSIVNWNNGVYFYEIKSETSSARGKFIIAK